MAGTTARAGGEGRGGEGEGIGSAALAGGAVVTEGFPERRIRHGLTRTCAIPVGSLTPSLHPYWHAYNSHWMLEKIGGKQ